MSRRKVEGGGGGREGEEEEKERRKRKASVYIIYWSHISVGTSHDNYLTTQGDSSATDSPTTTRILLKLPSILQVLHPLLVVSSPPISPPSHPHHTPTSLPSHPHLIPNSPHLTPTTPSLPLHTRPLYLLFIYIRIDMSKIMYNFPHLALIYLRNLEVVIARKICCVCIL